MTGITPVAFTCRRQELLSPGLQFVSALNTSQAGICSEMPLPGLTDPQNVCHSRVVAGRMAAQHTARRDRLLTGGHLG